MYSSFVSLYFHFYFYFYFYFYFFISHTQTLGGTAISKSIFLEIAKKQGPSEFVFLVAAVDHAMLLKRMVQVSAITPVSTGTGQ